jgi:hypothetical protein
LREKESRTSLTKRPEKNQTTFPNQTPKITILTILIHKNPRKQKLIAHHKNQINHSSDKIPTNPDSEKVKNLKTTLKVTKNTQKFSTNI